MNADIQVAHATSDAFEWPAGSERFQRYLTRLHAGNTELLVSNCETEYLLCRVGPHLMPISKNEAEYDNSYVCSPYGGAIPYACYELQLLPSRAMQMALRGLIAAVAPMLRMGMLNRCLIVNNWLLSTNLYSRWTGDGAQSLVDQLASEYPRHAILFRSLNHATNPELCEALVHCGFMLAPSRQTYIFDDPNLNYLNRSNTRIDLRLLEQNEEFQRVGPDDFTADDDQRVKELYDDLYLIKYTHLNPQFTTELIRVWREDGFLKFYGLRNRSGVLEGVVGCFQRAGVNSAPVVGYNTQLPQSKGLYRMLMAIVLSETAKSSQVLNLSSGAAGFKRLRGGSASVEYTGVYCRHLPVSQRAVWTLLASLLSGIGEPLLKKYEL